VIAAVEIRGAAAIVTIARKERTPLLKELIGGVMIAFFRAVAISHSILLIALCLGWALVFVEGKNWRIGVACMPLFAASFLFYAFYIWGNFCARGAEAKRIYAYVLDHLIFSTTFLIVLVYYFSLFDSMYTSLESFSNAASLDIIYALIMIIFGFCLFAVSDRLLRGSQQTSREKI
jgi:hypothetical protein